MTEAELVLASLTNEELDEARRYVGLMADAWRSGTRDNGTGYAASNHLRTDGPMHAIEALRLAVLREMISRRGDPTDEPWYAGMPTTDHPAGRILDLYQRRFAFRELEPRMNRAGVIERICVACGEAKPQDEEHFARIEGMWAAFCRLCSRPDVSRIPAEALDAPPSAALELL